MLLNAQMERRNAVAENNRMADQAAEQQAQQFEEQMKATLRGQDISALDTDYAGWAAGQLGADPNMIAVNEALRQDKQKAEGYGKYASGVATMEFDTPEEMIAGQNRLAGMTGGAMLGGGAGGQPAEQIIPDDQLRAALPAIQARAQRDGLTIGQTVRRADGSMVTKMIKPDGTTIDVPLNIQAQ
jgi:hypothetical protein